MTYTYKLSRRLAILRDLAVLPVALLAACMGETTGPESTSNAIPVTPIAFRVVPSAVTIETNQLIRFRGENNTRRGESYPSPLAWETSGGSIGRDGTFASNESGTFKVIGRGRGRQRPDTAIVVVVPPLRDLVGLEVSPEMATLEAGATHHFVAAGRMANGLTAPIGVVWTATGGTIDPSGEFTAGETAGSYQVIASNLLGTLADTASVSVTATDAPAPDPDPTPSPLPDPEPQPNPDSTPGPNPEPPAPPTPTLTSVVLKPGSAAIATGSTRQFYAFGRNSAGDSVPVAVTYTATGGTISAAGLYTGGTTAGTYRVIARAGTLADTSVVTLARTLGSSGGVGRPMGMSWLLSQSDAGTAPFTMSLDGYTADNILNRIALARSKNVRIMMNMTGGNHENYKTDGKFDLAKWRARMDTYNTSTIKQAVAAAVADGIIIGNSVMDEPHNETEAAGWGGNLTKEIVDGMCGYVKQIFPTLTVGVVHDHRQFEPEKNYRTCQFVVSQYRLSKGTVDDFRDGGLAFAKRSGIGIIFSLNVLHGGTPGTTCEKYGNDLSGNLCPMTPQQLRQFGLTLGTAGCALNMWRYEPAYYSNATIQQALREVADSMAKLPRKSCTEA
jgi:hypothetical protein